MDAIKRFNRFKAKATAIFGDKYDYDSCGFDSSNSIITLKCKEHGEFSVSARYHLSNNRGCPVCDSDSSRYDARRSTEFETFVRRAREVHGDKFIYLPENFTKIREVCTVICPTHGAFRTEAKYHLKSKEGCRFCYYENKKGTGAGKYSEDYFNVFPDRKNANGKLYLVKLNLSSGKECLKVGITYKDRIDKRFTAKSYASFEVIHIQTMNLYEAYLLEKKLLEALTDYRETFEETFSGYTECFKLKQEVIDIAKQHLGVNITYTLET